jgi:hypothetical protein
MKGQLIPVVFLVLLTGGVLIGYIFYNLFYGTKYQSLVFQVSVFDAVRNLIEYFKDYLKLSLTYSSHQSLREHACWGGTIGDERNHWICNGPNPVEVDQSKSCLEVYTKYYLNEYSALFETSLPAELTKHNFTDTIYDVDAGSVFSGKYDEGMFWVNSSGAGVGVIAKDLTESEKISTQDFITKNRYWYLFRNFYDWANDDVYSKCICNIIGCSCPSSSGEENCGSCDTPVKDCAQRALDDLQRRFDKDVYCTMERECCRQGIGPSCGYPNQCLNWDSRCAALCTHNCKDPSEGARSCEVTTPSFSSFSLSDLTPVANPSGNDFSLDGNAFNSVFQDPYSLSFQAACSCWYWYEGRVAAIYSYKCEDHKYYVQSDKGPVPLTFKVLALATWRNPQACKDLRTCECGDQTGCCTPCV